MFPSLEKIPHIGGQVIEGLNSRVGTNGIDGIWGPSSNVIMNDKNCEVNLVV